MCRPFRNDKWYQPAEYLRDVRIAHSRIHLSHRTAHSDTDNRLDKLFSYILLCVASN